MKTKLPSISLIMAVVYWATLTNNAHCQLEYTLTDLGTLGGSSSLAYGINNFGQVTGQSLSTGDGTTHAFLYSGGSMSDLGSLGGDESVGYGINNSGQVTGYSTSSNGIRAFLYSAGSMSDLGTLGDNYSTGRGINDSGQVTGWSSINSTTHPFLYSSGAMSDLGTLGGTFAYGTGGYSINNSGQVTGASASPTSPSGLAVTHAFLYSGGSMHDLGALGDGYYSRGLGVNNSGQVTGESATSNYFNNIHAFLYSGGSMKDLGTLGGSFSSGSGINNSGWVVGNSTTSSGGTDAFLYKGGAMTDLNSYLPSGTSVTVTQANAINDRGQIAAGASNGHAVLLTPTLASQQVNRQPITALTTKQTVSNTDLKVFSNGQFLTNGTIDTTLPTVVLTHGLDSSPGMWVDLARAISQNSNVNVVAWDWSGEANTGLLGVGLAESRTLNQGNGLGLALGNLLGSNYNNSVQFFGHSLGTLVDAQAVNVLHSLVSGATIQDTLFDDAELANLGGSGTWISPVPQAGTAALIDNYISSVGNPHPEATNIVLDKPASMNYVDFHGYPVTWYQPTVSGTTVNGSTAPTTAGFNISIIKSPSILTTGTFAGTYYEGGTDGSVHQINAVTAAAMVLSRRVDELVAGVSVVGQVTADGITAAVQTEGHVIVSLGEGLNVAVQLIKHSPSYAWLPITIPTDAQTMLLDFKFDNLSDGDWLSIGISDTLLFALEAQFAGNGQLDTTTPLDVSQWAGQSVELFLGLNNVDDLNAGGSITVDNIRFESVPEPSTWTLIIVGIGALALKRKMRNRTTALFPSPAQE